MKAETSKTWNPLRDVLNILNWHYCRLENNSGDGVPDINFCIPGDPHNDVVPRDIWLEAKYLKDYPKKFHIGESELKVGIRPTQYSWIRQAVDRRRQVWVVCRVKDDWLLWHITKGSDITKLFHGFRIGDLKMDVFKTPLRVLNYIAENYGIYQ